LGNSSSHEVAVKISMMALRESERLGNHASPSTQNQSESSLT
jgi:hypothetical protein